MQKSNSKFGSASGTDFAYAIEVRTTHSSPTTLPCGMIVDREWRMYPIRLLRCDRPDHSFTIAQANGVPVRNLFLQADNLGLMDFHAAYAVMAALHAQANNAGELLGGLCLETRLIEVKVTFSWAAEVSRVGEPLDMYALKKASNWEANTSSSTPSSEPSGS